ncbi:MAG TPA: EAL domain-containing protein [Azospirillum sp.]
MTAFPHSGKRLARRLILGIVLGSTLITLVITTLQLYQEYRRDIGEIDSRFEQIEESYLGSIVQNVWLADRSRLMTLLDGIRRLPDFALAEVQVDGKPFAASGTAPERGVLTRQWPLTVQHRGQTLDIGTLTVTASLEGVFARAMERIGFILAANAVKTSLVALLIFLLVDRLVTRHLWRMADYTRRIGAGDLDTPLHLDRRDRDEIYDLARSIDDMREGLRTYSSRLQGLNAELERTLGERTEALRRSRASEAALEESRAHLAQAQKIASLGSWEWDPAADTVTRTDELATIFGFADPAVALTLAGFLDRVDPQDRAAVAAAIARTWNGAPSPEGGAGFSIEHRIVRPDGGVRIVHHQGELVGRDGDLPPRVVGIVQDITDRKRAEEELAMAASVFSNTQEGIIVTDADGRILSVNKAFTDITGYPADEAVGRTPEMLRSGYQDDAFFEEMWKELHAAGFWQGEVWNRRRSGEAYLQWESVTTIRDADGRPKTHIVIFSDITEMRRKDERLRYQAYHDVLTGLANRTLLQDRLEHALSFARRADSAVAVLFLDLDRFKLVNDSLGHQLGDELLKSVATRITGCLAGDETVARTGGDEFVIVLTDFASTAEVAHVADRVMEALTAPFALRGHDVHVGVSIGIGIFPQDGGDVATLMKNADTAMFKAKDAGRNTFRFFDTSMNSRAVERLDLEAGLRRALQNGELELHYQPQIDLADGGLRGVEALVRWRHPERGLIPPGDFIPLAEETGLIAPLGEWVLHEASRQARRWRDAGLRIGRMAVNVSARQFEDREFINRIIATLATTGLAAKHLEVELTESVLMARPEQAIRTLHALREAGIAISVDDFGTGYSSLAYLKNLPISALKIDRAFVSDVGEDRRDQAIVETIITLGRSLDLAIVAEGVETARQLDFLTARRCDCAQGFYFSRPLPAAMLEHTLATGAAAFPPAAVAAAEA